MLLDPVNPQRRAPRPKKPRKSARHALRKKLVRMITEGKFRAGEQLMQTHLARKFGVSVSVMREALLDVQAYGLAETHDNRGFFVRKLDADALLDLYDLRGVLEGLAARKACGHITPGEVAELRGLIDRMCEAHDRGAEEQRAELDRAFHDRINQISRSHSLLSLTRQCNLFGKVVYTNTNTSQRIRELHEPLLEAIAQNRPEHAEALAREHILHGRREFEQMLANGRDIFYWLGGQSEPGERGNVVKP
ncbi:MAG: GntR family transcriptional regulator [Opitutaceae bacterium]|nr:GntR family transcriptional regulator [Opitutaceae bacterium]